jgi:competence protein ComEA
MEARESAGPAAGDGAPLPRPGAPASPLERLGRSLRWFGLARAVAVVVAVVAVGAGGYWLLRTPPPSVESSLPFASSTTIAAPGGRGAAPSADTPPPTTTAPVVVHVAGAVTAPGVYPLAAGARVIDAIATAGGLRGDADVDALNEAALVRDGERIYVPAVGETVPAVVTGGAGPGGTTSSEPTGPLDLNTATVEQLDTLPGVGPATAAAIVSHRDEHGPFASVDDLADVRGIGPAKLDELRDLVRV